LKLKCDEPLSNFAFNFNLRRYIMEAFTHIAAAINRVYKELTLSESHPLGGTAGRCGMTVSKPELKARLVSAIST
jgi:hypothetical protein